MTGSSGRTLRSHDGRQDPTGQLLGDQHQQTSPPTQKQRPKPTKRRRNADSEEQQSPADTGIEFVILSVILGTLTYSREHPVMVLIRGPPSPSRPQQAQAHNVEFLGQTWPLQPEHAPKRSRHVDSRSVEGTPRQAMPEPLSTSSGSGQQLTFNLHPNPLRDVPMGEGLLPSQPPPQVVIHHKVPVNCLTMSRERR